MKSLLLIAHGSRRSQSNEEVKELAEKLKEQCADEYNIIHAAFLELADPLIPDGIKMCVDDGASSVTVLPYFLNSGRHVIEDIPNIVNDTKQNYPDINIKISSHLGASALMMDLLISTAHSAE
ncbi:MAG: CbiX/SirB N-terminal domain-containing protein [Gammaproteobacteria bacterium]|nr:CbiX/SirB N-terminal domain-containing protein [Gammaproteobacteria bacterium]